eukprot:TRINITY_DN2452_c0_g1_i1.p3 TRINITY_DN2452_c0_g1~~TRINITY_DN2452_c0_g1_i1.p3  ORF type:complete len:347 (+),score=15.05 TRINITY_DN2452_c0_g1_i1:158-1042(+)
MYQRRPSVGSSHPSADAFPACGARCAASPRSLPRNCAFAVQVSAPALQCVPRVVLAGDVSCCCRQQRGAADSAEVATGGCGQAPGVGSRGLHSHHAVVEAACSHRRAPMGAPMGRGRRICRCAGGTSLSSGRYMPPSTPCGVLSPGGWGSSVGAAEGVSGFVCCWRRPRIAGSMPGRAAGSRSRSVRATLCVAVVARVRGSGPVVLLVRLWPCPTAAFLPRAPGVLLGPQEGKGRQISGGSLAVNTLRRHAHLRARGGQCLADRRIGARGPAIPGWSFRGTGGDRRGRGSCPVT